MALFSKKNLLFWAMKVFYCCKKLYHFLKRKLNSQYFLIQAITYTSIFAILMSTLIFYLSNKIEDKINYEVLLKIDAADRLSSKFDDAGIIKQLSNSPYFSLSGDDVMLKNLYLDYLQVKYDLYLTQERLDENFENSGLSSLGDMDKLGIGEVIEDSNRVIIEANNTTRSLKETQDKLFLFLIVTQAFNIIFATRLAWLTR